VVLDLCLSVSSFLKLSCDSYIALLHLLEEVEKVLSSDEEGATIQ